MIRKTFMKAIWLTAFASAAYGADFSDPTWPCIQRKVERLSVGLMWPSPLEPVVFDDEVEAAAQVLAERLVLRRTPLEDLSPQVTEFAETYGQDPILLGHVFEESFRRLSNLRSRLMSGIADYSQKQIALAQRIDDTRSEMDRLMAATDPDYDRVDALEEQLDWDERIYTDRQRSLTYVCETPVLIERRLYGISQMLQAAAG